MARDTKRVLDGTISSFKELKEQVKAYKDELATLEVGSKQWVETAQKLANAQKQVDAINKAAKGNLGAYDKQQANSINALKERIKLLNQERNAMDMSSKEYKAATAELKVLNDKLRESGTSAGDWRANVGNYASAIKESFGELGSAASGVSTAMLGLNASMLKLASNPVGAVVLAIAAAVAALARGIASSEENTNRWNQVLAPLKALLTDIERFLQRTASQFLTFAENVQKSGKDMNAFKVIAQGVIYIFNEIKGRIEAAGRVAKSVAEGVKKLWENFKAWGSGLKETFEPVLNFFNDIAKAFKTKLQPVVDWIIKAYNKLAERDLGKMFGLKTIEEIKQSWKEAGETADEYTEHLKEETKTQRSLAKQEADLAKQRRNAMVAEQTLQGEIAELENEIAEARQDRDYERALDALNKKREKEIQLAGVRQSLAAAELSLIKQRNSLSDSTTKDLDAEAQASANLANATNAAKAANTAFTKEETRLRREMEAYNKAQKAEEFKNAVAQLNAELKTLGSNYDNVVASLKKPLQPEGGEVNKDSLNSYYDQLQANNEAEYQAYVALTEAKIAELERFISLQKAAGNDTTQQELQLAALRKEQAEGYIKQYAKMINANNAADKDRAKKLKALQRSEISSYADLFDSVSGMFEQNTIAYKATATAKALINTYLAATSALAETPGGAITKAVAMAATLAAGIAQVIQIWKTDIKNPSVNGASSTAVAQPSVAESHPYTYTRSLQTTEEEDALNQPMFVSVTDINNMQKKVQVTDKESKF